MGWTPEQLDAINARGTGIIVSAAAGSGKTSVLVERLIRILSDTENKVPADRIVVVTFTNDAAAQMKQRLSKALSERIMKSGDQWLSSQQALLQTANISTIHSFCFDLIRENINLVDVSAGFRILDDTEENMLKRNAVAEAFEKFYAEQPDTMRILCDFFSSRVSGDAELEERVLDIYEFLVSIPFYQDWMKKWKEYYSAGFVPEKDAFAQHYTAHLEGSYTKALGLATYAGEKFSELFGRISTVIEDEKSAVSGQINKLKNKNWDDRVNCPKWSFPDITKELKDLKKTKDDDEVKQVSAIRDLYKKELKKTYSEIFTLDEIKDDFQKHSEILEKLFSLIECFDSELRRMKNGKNALGFSDAEQLAVKLLAERDEVGNIVKTPLARELSEYYELVMIDEFQDANGNQDLIFKMLSRGGTAEKGGTNLFTVGDMKQSIYRFRLANSKLFRNALDAAEKYTGEDFQGTNASVLLNRNFRSSKDVIDFVNYTFGKIMSRQVGDVDHTGSEALVYGREPLVFPEEYRTTEIIIVPEKAAGNGSSQGQGNEDNEEDSNQNSGENSAQSSGEKDDQEKVRSIIERRTAFDRNDGDQDDEAAADAVSEAKATALKIHSMLGRRTLVEGDRRRVCEPRDFCILLRKGRFAEAYVRELEALGIKAHAEGPKGYLRSREISVLMSMLAVIDNPMQNIHLATVLMSPMFMLNAEDMAVLAELNEGGKYFSVIKMILGEEPDEASDEDNDKAAGEAFRTAGEKPQVLPGSPLYAKLEKFMQTFVKLRYCAASQRLERFIRTIYDSTDFLSSVQVYKDGEQKKANLRLLMDIAEGYEKNSGGGIPGFVRYMDTLMKRNDDLERASVVSAGENAVSVKTIHKSKGLEFPFVFLCETSSGLSSPDQSGSMQIDPDHGIAFGIQDRKELRKYDSFPQLVLADINKRNQMSEEMRLLYVALTRAREQLFITVPDIPRVRKSIDSLRLRVLMSGGITPEILSEASSMLDWISAAMMVHPDGEWFRKGEKLAVEETEAKVRVSIFSGEAAAEASAEAQAAQFDENSVRALEEAFAYNYSDELTMKIAKITVTEIAKSEGEDVFEPRIPDIAARDGLTAAERGTAMHTFMQYVRYSDGVDGEYLASEARRLTDGGFLSEEERESLNMRQLLEFFDSEIYRRIISVYTEDPALVRREQKFLIKKSDLFRQKDEFSDKKFGAVLDDEALKEYNNDSMIQGIADCMFEEKGRIILVDYKTDMVNSPDTLVSRYDLQLRLYAAAMSRIFGMEVGEAYLYSFSLGKTVRVF